jgi:xanthine dehydrogenase accessory factor
MPAVCPSGTVTRRCTGDKLERVREVAEALLDVLKSGQRAALATVVRTSGSTPQEPGARLLLRADGGTVGTVGGGAIEQAVLEAMRETLRTGRPQLITRQLGYDLGMCCGGKMEVFVEAVEGVQRLVIFGAGHVARPTAALARGLGFDVTIVDEREELATAERFPGCTIARVDPAAHLQDRALGEHDWIIIVTHDHRLDEELLDRALQQHPRYIGLVGSRRKVFRTLDRIAARRGGDVDLGRVFAPIGLDVGAIGPDEIAVSIAGELVALRRGHPAAHMRAVDEWRAQNQRADAEADVDARAQVRSR